MIEEWQGNDVMDEWECDGVLKKDKVTACWKNGIILLWRNRRVA